MCGHITRGQELKEDIEKMNMDGKRPKCPKCGCVNLMGGICSQCGIDVSKYMDRMDMFQDPIGAIKKTALAYRRYLEGKRVFFAPDIPADILKKTIETYDKKEYDWGAEEILLISDDSIPAADKTGFSVVTSRNFICSNSGILSAYDLNSAESVKVSRVLADKLEINHENTPSFIMHSIDPENRTYLVRMISDIANIVQRSITLGTMPETKTTDDNNASNDETMHGGTSAGTLKNEASPKNVVSANEMTIVGKSSSYISENESPSPAVSLNDVTKHPAINEKTIVSSPPVSEINSSGQNLFDTMRKENFTIEVKDAVPTPHSPAGPDLDESPVVTKQEKMKVDKIEPFELENKSIPAMPSEHKIKNDAENLQGQEEQSLEEPNDMGEDHKVEEDYMDDDAEFLDSTIKESSRTSFIDHDLKNKIMKKGKLVKENKTANVAPPQIPEGPVSSLDHARQGVPQPVQAYDYNQKYMDKSYYTADIDGTLYDPDNNQVTYENPYLYVPPPPPKASLKMRGLGCIAGFFVGAIIGVPIGEGLGFFFGIGEIYSYMTGITIGLGVWYYVQKLITHLFVPS
jgi:hypothetical protein